MKSIQSLSSVVSDEKLIIWLLLINIEISMYKYAWLLYFNKFFFVYVWKILVIFWLLLIENLYNKNLKIFLF